MVKDVGHATHVANVEPSHPCTSKARANKAAPREGWGEHGEIRLLIGVEREILYCDPVGPPVGKYRLNH